MSDLTPASVINTLTEIGKRIDAVTAELPELEMAELKARHSYKLGYAESFLRLDHVDEEGQRITESIRRARADVDCALLYFEAEAAAVRLKTKRDELKALQARLDIGRSLSAVMRAEWGQS